MWEDSKVRTKGNLHVFGLWLSSIRAMMNALTGVDAHRLDADQPLSIHLLQGPVIQRNVQVDSNPDIVIDFEARLPVVVIIANVPVVRPAAKLDMKIIGWLTAWRRANPVNQFKENMGRSGFMAGGVNEATIVQAEVAL